MVMASTSTTTPGAADVPVHGGPTSVSLGEVARRHREVVACTLDLLDAPEGATGYVVRDRSEAALLTVLAARDARPDVPRPRVVVPDSVDPAYHRAGRLLGVEVLCVPTDATRRAQVGPMAHAMDGDTVLVVVSAPAPDDGVIDPVTWIGTAAAAKRVPLHVDASAGGWLLALAGRMGRVVPPWTFAAPGTSTIAMVLDDDPGADGVVLAFRDPTRSRSCGLPGSGPPRDTVLSAWRRLHELGEDGFLRVAGATMRAVDALLAGVPDIPGLRLLSTPEAGILVLGAEVDCDVFTIAEELRSRGWYADTRVSRPGEPARLRLTVDRAAGEHPEDCVAALHEAVAAARTRGPVGLPRRVVDHLVRLDVDTLSTDDLVLLLDALGLDAATATHAARFMALLDAAGPRLRDALVVRQRELLLSPARLSGSAWPA